MRRLAVLIAGMLAVGLGAGERAANALAFRAAVPLNRNAPDDIGADEFPSVATDGRGNWVAVWQSSDPLNHTVGTDLDIFVSRSGDDAKTWTRPRALVAIAASDTVDDRLARVATDGDGRWVVVWQSTNPLGDPHIGRDNDILVVRSNDNGRSWTYPAPLNTTASGDVGNDGEPDLVTDGKGTWLCVWSSADPQGVTIGPDWDILVARSRDAGRTWSNPQVVNSNAHFDFGDDGAAALATDGHGHWVVVWQSSDDQGGAVGSDWDIMVARSEDDGRTWSPRSTLNTNAGGDAGGDRLPRVATDGRGRWITAWTSSEALGGGLGTDTDVLFAVSEDRGASWSAPRALNTNADDDLESDWQPWLASAGNGHWVAVWQSTARLNFGEEPEWHIVFSESRDDGESWSASTAVDSVPMRRALNGLGIRPQLVAGGASSWAAVWAQRGGTPLGSDGEIFIALGGPCGDGTVDPGEQCDDGNYESGDCCSPTCRFEQDGSPCPGGVCRETGTCMEGRCVALTPRRCDDGNICNGIEVCDPNAGGCQPGVPLGCDLCQLCDPTLGCVGPPCTPVPEGADAPAAKPRARKQKAGERGEPRKRAKAAPGAEPDAAAEEEGGLLNAEVFLVVMAIAALVWLFLMDRPKKKPPPRE